MEKTMTDERVFVALDLPSVEEARVIKEVLT
jgi:hypothetical protein